jgi:hypothetical protein
MRQAVPLFGRAPHARPGDPGAERRALEAPAGHEGAWLDSDAGRTREPGLGSGPERQADERGMWLVQRLQANTVAERGYALSPDELATALGTVTTFPGDIIAKLAHASSHDRVTAGAGRTRDDGVDGVFPGHSSHDGSEQVAGDRTTAQLAAESFPCTAADAVVTAVNSGTQVGRSRTYVVMGHRIRSAPVPG